MHVYCIWVADCSYSFAKEMESVYGVFYFSTLLQSQQLIMCCHAQESQLKGYTERIRWSSAAPIKSRKAQPCQLKLLLCPVKKEKCLILMPTVARLQRSRPSGHQVRVETGRGGSKYGKVPLSYQMWQLNVVKNFLQKNLSSKHQTMRELSA